MIPDRVTLRGGAVVTIRPEERRTGGYGSVCRTDRDDLLYKHFHAPLSPALDRRLAAVLAHASAVEHPGVCWPVAAVRHPSGAVLGCLVVRARGRTVPLTDLAVRSRREAAGLPGHPAFRAAAGATVAAIVARLHRGGWVIGDLRRENVVVAGTPSTLDRIRLVDTDGLWAPGLVDGAGPTSSAFGAGGGAPELLHGTAGPSVEADRWALAVLVYETLSAGCHPFSTTGRSHLGLNAAIRAGETTRLVLEHLPAEVRGPMRRALHDGHRDPSARPGAEVWVEALTRVVRAASR